MNAYRTAPEELTTRPFKARRRFWLRLRIRWAKTKCERCGELRFCRWQEHPEITLGGDYTLGGDGVAAPVVCCRGCCWYPDLWIGMTRA